MIRTLTCVLLVLAFLAVGCTAEVSTVEVHTSGDPAGFWLGLWHGMICWISLIWGWFDPSVAVYQIDNTGGWYDFGFLIGVGMTAGSGSAAVRRRRSQRAEA